MAIIYLNCHVILSPLPSTCPDLQALQNSEPQETSEAASHSLSQLSDVYQSFKTNKETGSDEKTYSTILLLHFLLFKYLWLSGFHCISVHNKSSSSGNRIKVLFPRFNLKGTTIS